MHQDRTIQCFLRIQYCRKNLVFDLDHLHRTFHTRFIFSGNDRHRISHKAHMLIQDQPVIRTWLRPGLACSCKALLRYILPGINCFDSRHAHCHISLDLPDHCIGMRTSQKLNDQAFLRRQIICIYRLSSHQCHRIFFYKWYSYCFHLAPPFLLYSRKS